MDYYKKKKNENVGNNIMIRYICNRLKRKVLIHYIGFWRVA